MKIWNVVYVWGKLQLIVRIYNVSKWLSMLCVSDEKDVVIFQRVGKQNESGKNWKIYCINAKGTKFDTKAVSGNAWYNR